jgi:hypothetical protein
MIPRVSNSLTAFALFLASAACANAQALAVPKEKPAKAKEHALSLTTGYIADPFKLDDGKGWHFIHVKVTLDKVTRDAKGAGKGTMEFDPNRGKFNEFGDVSGPFTEIATRKTEVTLKLVKTDGSRLLYEIEGQRWSLVVDRESTGHRLLWKDKDGKTQHVLPLSDVSKPKENPCHPGCFPAKTNILTPDGARAVETIRAGDQILAVDKKGKPCPAKVRSVFVSQAFLVEIETDSGRLITTGKQPLCIAGGTCKTAEDLMPGEELLSWQDGKGQPTKVRAVQKTNKLAQVFNLVLEDQEYFIAGGFLVRSKPPLTADATEAISPEPSRKSK